MIQKICPFCRLDSYSAYNDPNWCCPYCGQNIGDSRSKELISKKKKKLSTASIQHLRVVNYNSESFLNYEKEVK